MRAKPSRLLPLWLWLSGCATPVPTPPEPATPAPSHTAAQESVPSPEAELWVDDRVLTLSRMSTGLEQVTALEPKAAKMMIAQLQTGADDRPAGERFELALLLTRNGADDKSLKRAWRLLNRLEEEALEPAVRELLRMQRLSLDREQRYRLERRKTIELQKKIEHLKGLERELDESNKRLEEPLPPKPEPAQ